MESSIEDEILAITVTSAANKIHSIQNKKKEKIIFVKEVAVSQLGASEAALN